MNTVKIDHVTYGYSLDCQDLGTVTLNHAAMSMTRGESVYPDTVIGA